MPSIEQRIGTTIGAYVVEGPLGQGGFGEVVLARHQRLQRQVALKLLKPDAGSTRFLREAQLLAQLEHPNIVQVYDFGEADAQLFMALELIRGETLLHRLRTQGALPPAEAAWILDGVLAALAHAHQHGVLHRDVKPANILLEQREQEVGVKLVDFGISQGEHQPRLTQTGDLVGTPRYLAPELLDGAAPDATADVWAAGIVLHECLNGRPAYNVPGMEVLFAVSQGPPESLRGKGLNGRLLDVLETALSPKSSRFQSAQAFRTALSEATRAAPVKRTTRVQLVAGGEGESASLRVPQLAPPQLAPPALASIPQTPVSFAPPAHASIPATPQSPTRPSSVHPGATSFPPPAAPTRRRITPLVLGLLAVGLLGLVGLAGVGAIWADRTFLREPDATSSTPPAPPPAPELPPVAAAGPVMEPMQPGAVDPAPVVAADSPEAPAHTNVPQPEPAAEPPRRPRPPRPQRAQPSSQRGGPSRAQSTHGNVTVMCRRTEGAPDVRLATRRMAREDWPSCFRRFQDTSSGLRVRLRGGAASFHNQVPGHCYVSALNRSFSGVNAGTGIMLCDIRQDS
ncbi:MAG: protein kinase [Sandaracinaceae bacterium]